MNDGFFWQPFFYPLFLSIIYLASNLSIICAKIVQLLLGGLTCLLTYRLGKTIFNPGIGIIAGLITALYGPLIFFEAELLASGWGAFWSVVLILLFLETSSRKSPWLYVVLGICGALSIITRPTFIPFFAAASGWLAIRLYHSEDGWRRLIPRLAGILGGFLLIAIPVAVQNLRITGHFGVLPASGGINLFVGNNPNYTEMLTARPGWGWEEITSLPEQDGVSSNMWEQQEYFNKKVMDFVSTQPLMFAKGLVYKSVQFLNSRELPRNVDIYLFGKWSSLLSLLAWKAGRFGFPFGVLLPLAILGLASYWRQIPVPIKLFLILYPLSIILVFVTARYRVPVIPVMSVVAAAGLLSLLRMIRSPNWHRIMIIGIFGVGVVALSSLPGPFPEELINYEPELYANVAATEMARGKNDIAIEYLNKALSLQNNYPSAHANLGVVLAKKGELEKAVTHYKIALDFKDDSPEVHNNLAAALADTGKIHQAIAHYNRALQLRPYYAEAHYNLGNLLVAAEKIEDAVKHLRKAAQIKQDYFKAHNSLGVALAAQGDIEQAVVHFSHAVRLKPDDHNVRCNLAMALANSGRSEEAVKEYREALRIHPNAPQVLIELARILAFHENARIRNVSQAIELAKKACELTGYKHVEAIDALAKAYGAAGKFAEAAFMTGKALEIVPPRGDWGKYLQKQLQYYKDKAVGPQQRPSPTKVGP